MKLILFAVLTLIAVTAQAGTASRGDAPRKNIGAPCMLKVGTSTWINGSAVTHVETWRSNVEIRFGYSNQVTLDYGTALKAAAGVTAIATLIKDQCQ